MKTNNYNTTNWGLHCSVDVYNCNGTTIRDADKIKQFVSELCKIIDMKPYGDTVVTHFGEDDRVAGYSMIQLIETSLISAHFANYTNTVYLDVFSCKHYNVSDVEEFTKYFFEGNLCIVNVTDRK